MQQMQEELAGIEIEGQSGAGLVKVTLNGKINKIGDNPMMKVASAGFDADVVLRLATAAVAAVLVVLSQWLSPPLVLWLLAAVLVAQVALELATHEEHTAHAPPGPI